MILTFHKEKKHLVTLMDGRILLDNDNNPVSHSDMICNRIKDVLQLAFEDNESIFVTIVLVVTSVK